MIEYVSSWFTPTILFCVLNLMIGTIFISSSLKPHQNKKQHHQLGDDDNSVPQLTRVPSLLERVRSFNYSLRQDQSVSDPFSHAQNTYPFSRTPSLLERLGAVNLPFSRSGDFPATTHYADPPENGAHHNAPLAPAPSFLERVRSINLSFSRSEQPDPFPSTTHHTESPEAQTRKVEDNSESVMSHARRTKSATLAEIPAFSKKKMKKSASEKMKVDPEETEEEVDRRRPATVREKNTAKFDEEDDAVDEKADDFINRFKQQLKLQRLDSLLRYKETLNRRVGN